MAVSFTLMQYIHEARLRITTDDHELAGCQTKNDERKQLSTTVTRSDWESIYYKNTEMLPKTPINALHTTQQNEQEHTIPISIVLLHIASDPLCTSNLWALLANGIVETRQLSP